MSAPCAVRYYGGGDLSGYGLAAVANVRALVNAGLAVQWVPLEWTPTRLIPGQWQNHEGESKPVLKAQGSALADVATLVEQTRRPLEPDAVIAHAPPESWPGLFRKQSYNIGCTVWETSRTPAHWRPLMTLADTVAVPSEFNRRIFQAAVPEAPVAVLPHIRRHTWNDYTPSEIRQGKADLGIPADHRVFYTISTWDPRKALPELISLFVRAFYSETPVTLLIKTNASGVDAGPHYQQRPTQTLAAETVSEISRELGREAPNIILNTDQLDSAELDMIHAIGDVYVTVSHGEGFGLGAFEAATRATPVLAPAWGGQTEFLGKHWLGALPFRMSQAPLWPPDRPSYFPSQRWACVEPEATVLRMQEVLSNSTPFEREARVIRERIVERFAEPVIAAQWLELIESALESRTPTERLS